MPTPLLCAAIGPGRRALAALALFVLAAGSPPRPQTDVQAFFAPHDDFPPALVELLLSAEESIDVAMYSFFASSKRDDARYESLKKSFEITPLDALREATQRGVRVRMVLHKATTYQWSMVAVPPLVEAGVEVYAVGPTMHEKYAIVDGRHVVNGSGNWSAGAFHRYHENWILFRDDPALASQFQRNMNALLRDSARVVLDDEGEPVAAKGDVSAPRVRPREATSEVYFTTDNEGTRTTVVEDVIIDHMRAAKEELVVAVAHFNTERLADELIAVHERGVDVRVLVDLGEYRNRYSEAERLERAGVDVRYHTYSVKHHFPFAKLMHHKFMIVDGEVLLNGSYNWSRTAEHSNHENLQVFRGAAWSRLVRTYEEKFEELWRLGRDDLSRFMRRLLAKEGTADYRRFLPCHFDTMSISGKELAAIRRVYSKAGFFRRRGGDEKSAWEFWSYDREERRGTNDWPPPPHEPFFDLEQLVVTEVCYNPERQKSGEFIELYNGSSDEIDLTGYVVGDGHSEDAIVKHGRRTTLLRPGRIALVVDPDFDADFALKRGVVVVTVGTKTIGNGLAHGDVVTLSTPDGKELDVCPLDARTAKGSSVTRRSVHLRSVPDNWTVAEASPGVHAAD